MNTIIPGTTCTIVNPTSLSNKIKEEDRSRTFLGGRKEKTHGCMLMEIAII